MAAPATPPTDPDALAVLHVLSSISSNPEDVYNALEGLRHMAGHAIAAALDTHKAELAAKIDTQTAKIDTHKAELSAKIDTQGAKIDAKIDTQNARFEAQSTQFEALQGQLTRERRILWTLVGLLGIAVLRSLIAG